MKSQSLDTIPDLLLSLDSLQADTGLNDTKLAAYLGIDRVSIVKFRSGIGDLPTHSKVAIYAHLGYFRALPWFKILLSGRASEKLTAWSHRHADWLARNPRRVERAQAITLSQNSNAVQRFEKVNVSSASNDSETEAEMLKNWFSLILDLQSMGFTPNAVRLALAPIPKATEPPSDPISIGTVVNSENKSWAW